MTIIYPVVWFTETFLKILNYSSHQHFPFWCSDLPANPVEAQRGQTRPNEPTSSVGRKQSETQGEWKDPWRKDRNRNSYCRRQHVDPSGSPVSCRPNRGQSVNTGTFFHPQHLLIHSSGNTETQPLASCVGHMGENLYCA